MDKEKQSINEILDAREKRAETQREIIDIYKKTLISFTLNIPGVEKHNKTFTKVHESGIKLLEEELEKKNIEVLYKLVEITADGNEAFIVVNAEPWATKRITTLIEENHKLGRLFDFDVFDENGEKLRRTGVGFYERRCLLCDNNAKACGRSRNHSLEELLDRIYELINHEELYI